MSNYLEKDAFAKLLGIKLIESGTDYAKCELEIKDHHKNGLGTVHGGLIFAFADVTYAIACNSELPSIGMQGDIRFLNQAKGSRLIAEATLVNKSSKIAHYDILVKDNEDTLVAKSSGLAYRFQPR